MGFFLVALVVLGYLSPYTAAGVYLGWIAFAVAVWIVATVIKVLKDS